MGFDSPSGWRNKTMPNIISALVKIVITTVCETVGLGAIPRAADQFVLVVKLEITKPYEGLVPDSNSGKSANLLPLRMVFPTLVF